MRIVVIGASGYIGSRLVPDLLHGGHEVTVLTRDPHALEYRFPAARVVTADVLEPATVESALAGADVAFYLARSPALDGRKRDADDAQGATSFGQAAAAAGVGRIVCLGWLGAAPHPTIGDLLAAHGTPVTELRVAAVIGSGGAAYEIVRHLTTRLPIIAAPRWVRVPCQPIGIRDLLDALVATLEHPEVSGAVELGGPEVLSYRDMFRAYARNQRLRRLFIPVPLWLIELSARWIGLVTPVPAAVARPNIEALRLPAVVTDPSSALALGIRPIPFAETLERATERTRQHEVESTWYDAFARRGRATLASITSTTGMLRDRRERVVDASPGVIYPLIERVGGAAGWPYANLLWRIRAAADRLVGGVGMRLGRRDPNFLRAGDALDFWRVESVRRPELLVLRAEMRVPGRAWLQYEVRQEGQRSRIVQTAFFEPRGLAGQLYWYVLLPFHIPIFRGTIRVLAQRAERAARSTAEAEALPS